MRIPAVSCASSTGLEAMGTGDPGEGVKTRSDAVGDLHGLQGAIDASGFDAVVAATPENVRYASDVSIPTQRNIRNRPAYVLWPAGQDPLFVIAETEQARVRRGSWIQRTVCYREFESSPMQALAQALTESGLTSGRIGCELEFMPAAYVADLSRLLPNLTIGACDDVFRRVRMVKTAREIEILSAGARATERAILATFATAHAGEDERSLMRRLSDAIVQGGAERVPFLHIYGGPNAAGPHLGPTARPIHAGDVVKADAGGSFDLYLSNVGRTAIVGRPSNEDAGVWAALRSIHRRVTEMLRPGEQGREIFRAADGMYRDAGFALKHPNNGHSIGLEVHERPQIGPHEDLRYRDGMVTTVETRLRFSETRSFHIEDFVQITRDGARVVTTAFPNDELFVI
jgi:Xaa-Pro dipeptidase